MTDNVVDADGQDDEHKDAEISVAAPAMPSDLAAAAMAVPPMPMSMPVVPVAVDPPVMVASVEEAGEPASQPLRPVPSNVVQVEDGLTPSDPSAEAEPNKKGDPIAVAAGKAQPPAQRSTSQAALPTDRPTASVDAVDDAPVPLAVPLAAPSVAPSAAPPLPSVDASEQVVAQTDRSEPPVPPGVDGSKATPGDQGMPIPVAVNQAAEPASVVEPASAIEPAATIAAPVRAEALSLLQLVRDHMNRRAMPSRDAADPAPAVGDRNEATRAVDPSLAMPTPSAHHGTTVAAPLAAAAQGANTAPAAMPTVDLSASLGQQVVDLGVSGQWIDGLARDIAGLSANGAQGRFQINADQLGPVQVDIRQGSDGAAVSLTVASEAAEIALRQDSDRLKLDAGLAAVRISEVKVERAPHVAEAQRADSQSGGQQSSAQQGQSGQQGAWQNGGQMAGQSMGQSSSQGRWQGRENNGPGHKSGGDPAVLNHGDAGDSAGDVRRARYA
ncbi:flagellar hook-length control protein FliK [Sphingobium sp. AP49]|uniref:flagellar hook-length control protein FliK n=1 Tax=Sphingobium sp. AP49 TaxID=1144307 RepID=UPI0024B3B2E3|nr:flagellar hook-length control protein FliK [Sphingobium sp. AP49]WHO38268.1 flagellar hook-length control protein FliK [Sphingobium sp. AP49]